MRIDLRPQAREDIEYYKRHSAKNLSRVKELIASILETPFQGIGKPEPLKYDLSGYWSRRVNQRDRLVYRIDEDGLIILQCRYHY